MPLKHSRWDVRSRGAGLWAISRFESFGRPGKQLVLLGDLLNTLDLEIGDDQLTSPERLVD
jgi:hypothetical protein